MPLRAARAWRPFCLSNNASSFCCALLSRRPPRTLSSRSVALISRITHISERSVYGALLLHISERSVYGALLLVPYDLVSPRASAYCYTPLSGCFHGCVPAVTSARATTADDDTQYRYWRAVLDERAVLSSMPALSSGPLLLVFRASLVVLALLVFSQGAAGARLATPYLDVFGEDDEGLRRGKPLVS